MFVSRLSFRTRPGHTREAEEALMNLLVLVQNAGVTRARVLRTHYASLGAADLVFEQEDEDMATLEAQLSAVTAMPEFQQWSQRMSEFLSASPKREVYMGVE